MIGNLQHLAIIPDGNRRWAKQHRVPALEGHRRGAEAIRNTVDYLITQKIEYLTVWGFSTDNWKRTRDEVSDIFRLLAAWIEKDAPWVNSRGVRLRHIGRLNELPDFLQRTMKQAVDLTKGNGGMTLNVAFNYSGRAEIVDAVRCLLKDNVPPEIDESLIGRYLYSDMPDVDLVIRTAGELRLSNFMLWQTAYSELYFSELFWPDFTAGELEKALLAYSERKRRFGGD